MMTSQDKIAQQTLRHVRAARNQLKQTPWRQQHLKGLNIDRAIQQLTIIEKQLMGEAQ